MRIPTFMFAIVAAMSLLGGPTLRAQDLGQARKQPTAVISLSGEIDNFSRDGLLKRFRQAKAAGARTIILKLDTPGGLVGASEDLSRFLRSQDRADTRTIAFVDHRALSGGVMVALACDEIVMTPGGVLGDAAPIAAPRETDATAGESSVLADLYASSLRNAYDPQITRSMVVAGGRRGEGLLTVDSASAQKLGLSKGTFASPQSLASSRNLDIIATFEPGVGDMLIELLSTPVARGILIVILIQTLYLALAHPGHGVPEVAAMLSAGLLLGIPLLTGFATWWEIAIIFVGLGLVALEIFVIPGHGVSGAIGLLLFLGGLVMTFVGTEPAHASFVPSLRGTWTNIGRGLVTVTAGLLCSMALWFWLQKYLPKLPYLNRLILTTTTGDTASMLAERPIETGPAIGDVGIAISELKPGGSVKFITDSYPDGRVAAAVSESGFIPSGTRVMVREVGGNRIVVVRDNES